MRPSMTEGVILIKDSRAEIRIQSSVIAILASDFRLGHHHWFSHLHHCHVVAVRDIK